MRNKCFIDDMGNHINEGDITVKSTKAEKIFVYEIRWGVYRSNAYGVLGNFTIEPKYRFFASEDRAKEFYESILKAKQLLELPEDGYLKFEKIEVEE